MTPRKPIQIILDPSAAPHESIFALCDDGTIWHRLDDADRPGLAPDLDSHWTLIPLIPGTFDHIKETLRHPDPGITEPAYVPDLDAYAAAYHPTPDAPPSDLLLTMRRNRDGYARIEIPLDDDGEAWIAALRRAIARAKRRRPIPNPVHPVNPVQEKEARP